jgi:hypothetical protein
MYWVQKEWLAFSILFRPWDGKKTGHGVSKAKHKNTYNKSQRYG